MTKLPGEVPPHALESEQAVVSAVLIEPHRLDEVRFLQPEHCYSVETQKILRAVYAVSELGNAPDVLQIRNWLRDNDTGIEITAQTLAFYAGQPYDINLVQNALIVYEKWRLRQIIATAKVAVAEAYTGREANGGPTDSQGVISRLDTTLIELLSDDKRSTFRTVGEAAAESLKAIEERTVAERDGTASASSVPTGIRALDAKLGALYAGDLYIIAARPGVGKSSLLRSILANVSRRGAVASALFTQEMPAGQVAMNLALAEAGVDTEVVRKRSLTREDFQNLHNAVADVMGYPIYLDDSSSITVDDVRARTMKLMRTIDRGAERGSKTKRVGLVAVDYLQLMRGRGDNREQEVASLSRGLKRLAMDLKVPVIALSQLNRAVETKKTKRPGLSDLRESGAIEQDADTILFIWRSDYYDKDEEPQTEIDIAKQRSGPTGVVPVHFEKRTTRFFDLETETADYYDGFQDV